MERMRAGKPSLGLYEERLETRGLNLVARAVVFRVSRQACLVAGWSELE